MMKVATAILTTILFLASCQNQNFSHNQKNSEMDNATEKKAIEQLIFTYRDALNASNTSKVLPLYTKNGVFMPSNAPTSVGQEQVKGAYDFVFKNIQLKIDFFIDEIEVHGDVAFARSISKGTTLIHANGQTVPEENRELFVLRKEDGSWKIDRYIFNKMK